MKRPKLFIVGSVLLVSFLSIATVQSSIQQDKNRSKWKAPPSADQLQNPFKNNSNATSQGNKLYKDLCAICHGNTGKGDGMAGVSLNPRPANLTSAKVQSQTDGALYWKITNGRPPMAPYKDILKPAQRWQLVNHIRTFKK